MRRGDRREREREGERRGNRGGERGDRDSQARAAKQRICHDDVLWASVQRRASPKLETTTGGNQSIRSGQQRPLGERGTEFICRFWLHCSPVIRRRNVFQAVFIFARGVKRGKEREGGERAEEEKGSKGARESINENQSNETKTLHPSSSSPFLLSFSRGRCIHSHYLLQCSTGTTAVHRRLSTRSMYAGRDAIQNPPQNPLMLTVVSDHTHACSSVSHRQVRRRVLLPYSYPYNTTSHSIHHDQANNPNTLASLIQHGLADKINPPCMQHLPQPR